MTTSDGVRFADITAPPNWSERMQAIIAKSSRPIYIAFHPYEALLLSKNFAASYIISVNVSRL